MGCLPAGAAIDHAPRRAAARDAVSAPDCSPACLHRLTSTGACAASLPRPANHSADALHCPFAEAFACLPTHPTFCAGRPGSSRWRPPCPSSCSPSQSCVGQMEWAPAQASDVECCAAMPSASSFLLDKRSGRQHRRAEQFRPQRQPLCILVLLLPRAAGNQQQSSKAEQFFPGPGLSCHPQACLFPRWLWALPGAGWRGSSWRQQCTGRAASCLCPSLPTLSLVSAWLRIGSTARGAGGPKWRLLCLCCPHGALHTAQPSCPDALLLPAPAPSLAPAGAAAFLGGSTRMTMTTTVMVMETSGALQLIVPLMLTVFFAKVGGVAAVHGSRRLLQLLCASCACCQSAAQRCNLRRCFLARPSHPPADCGRPLWSGH